MHRRSSNRTCRRACLVWLLGSNRWQRQRRMPTEVTPRIRAYRLWKCLEVLVRFHCGIGRFGHKPGRLYGATGTAVTYIHVPRLSSPPSGSTACSGEKSLSTMYRATLNHSFPRLLAMAVRSTVFLPTGCRSTCSPRCTNYPRPGVQLSHS